VRAVFCVRSAGMCSVVGHRHVLILASALSECAVLRAVLSQMCLENVVHGGCTCSCSACCQRASECATGVEYVSEEAMH